MCLQQLINARELAQHLGLSPHRTAFLEFIAKHAGEETQQLWYKQETIAAHLSCSVKTISRDIHFFTSLGLMHQQPRYLVDRNNVKHRTSDVLTSHIPTVAEWEAGVRYDGSTRPAIKNANNWKPGAPDIVELIALPEEEIESPIEQVASTVRDAVAYVRSTSEERAAIKEARARKREKRMNARKRERVLKAEAAMQARARNGRSKREIVMACMPQGVGVEAWTDTQIEDMYQLVQSRLNIGWMHVEIASILSEGMPSNVHNMFAFLRFRMENKINPNVSPAQKQEAARKQAEEARSKQDAAVEAMLNAEEDAESRERSRLFDMFYEQVRSANPSMSPRRVGAAANILVAEHLAKTPVAA